MKISTVDALKIDKLLRDRAFGDVYLNDFYNLFGKNKYKNEDYLEHYTTLLNNLLNKDEIQYKHFNKYLYVLFSFFEKGIFDYKYDAQKIKELHNNYKLFLERTSTELDNTAEEYFAKMDEIIDKSVQVNIKEKEAINKKLLDEKDKENKTLSKKIEKLEEKELEKKEKITKLQKTIKKYEKEISKLNTNLNKKDIDYSTLKDNYDELVLALNNLKLEYSKLQEEYNKLFINSKNSEELLEKNKDLKEEITDLKIVLESLSELENQLDKSNKEIEKLKTKIKELNGKNDDNSLMVSSILSILYDGPATLNEIDKKLNNKGIHFPKKDLFKVLSTLNNIVNIESKTITEDGPVYEINNPLYIKNRFYDLVIPEENCYIDLLLTADYHIFDLKPEFYRNYEALGDYATKNNIKTIVNLGDFFDFGIEGYQKNLYQYKKIKEAIDTCIEKIPYIPNTTQLVLGGNHDVWNMYLGFDFLKYFIENRIDFSSLGYEKATLILKKKQDLFKMLLSHTNHNLERNNLKERIENINNGLGIKQNRDMYVFGHSHESYLDLTCNVCVVPSLTVDKVCNGAWHIRIYLDDFTISYKPLIIAPKSGELARKLIPTSEIIHRK